jgi:hypothetical protein
MSSRKSSLKTPGKLVALDATRNGAMNDRLESFVPWDYSFQKFYHPSE